MSTYLCCLDLPQGVTMIGFMHVNAALYFLWRVTLFETYYWFLHAAIAALYCWRATYFALMVTQDSSPKSRSEYSQTN